MIKVSVIIPTYNRRKSLKECLESLTVQNCPPDTYEIIVVDDGSNDDTINLLKELEKKTSIQLISLRQQHMGVSHACNVGIKYSKGEIIVFTEDDVVVEQDWVKKILYYHNKYPDILAIQGRIYIPSGNNIIGILESMIWENYLKYIIYNFKGNSFIYLFCTANCSVKARLFKEEGFFFNEMLFSYEDSDIRNHLLANNRRILYTEDIKVIHKSRSNFTAFVKKYFRDGRGFYLGKAIWKKGEHAYSTEDFNQIRFFIEITNQLIIKYRLKGLLLIALYILRKIITTYGYIYEKIKSN